MHGLVHDGEQRDDHEAVEEERGRQPPVAARGVDQQDAGRERGEVRERARGATHVGPRVELRQDGRRNQPHLLRAPPGLPPCDGRREPHDAAC